MIFIDGGTNRGQTIEWAWKVFGKNIKIYSFEANPELHEYLQEKYSSNLVNLISKGVWDEDGKMVLNLDHRSDATTFFTAKKFKKSVIIETVNLSRWLKENLSTDEYVVLKLNVEGAEYRILQKLLDDNTIQYLNEIYCSFHNKLKSLPKSFNNRLRRQIKERGVKIHTWYGNRTKRFNEKKNHTKFDKFF